MGVGNFAYVFWFVEYFVVFYYIPWCCYCVSVVKVFYGFPSVFGVVEFVSNVCFLALCNFFV